MNANHHPADARSPKGCVPTKFFQASPKSSPSSSNVQKPYAVKLESTNTTPTKALSRDQYTPQKSSKSVTINSPKKDLATTINILHRMKQGAAQDASPSSASERNSTKSTKIKLSSGHSTPQKCPESAFKNHKQKNLETTINEFKVKKEVAPKDDDVICLTPKKQSVISDHFIKKERNETKCTGQKGIQIGLNECTIAPVQNDLPFLPEMVQGSQGLLELCLQDNAALDNLTNDVSSIYENVRSRKLCFDERVARSADLAGIASGMILQKCRVSGDMDLQGTAKVPDISDQASSSMLLEHPTTSTNIKVEALTQLPTRSTNSQEEIDIVDLCDSETESIYSDSTVEFQQCSTTREVAIPDLFHTSERNETDSSGSASTDEFCIPETYQSCLNKSSESAENNEEHAEVGEKSQNKDIDCSSKEPLDLHVDKTHSTDVNTFSCEILSGERDRGKFSETLDSKEYNASGNREESEGLVLPSPGKFNISKYDSSPPDKFPGNIEKNQGNAEPHEKCQNMDVDFLRESLAETFNKQIDLYVDKTKVTVKNNLPSNDDLGGGGDSNETEIFVNNSNLDILESLMHTDDNGDSDLEISLLPEELNINSQHDSSSSDDEMNLWSSVTMLPSPSPVSTKSQRKKNSDSELDKHRLQFSDLVKATEMQAKVNAKYKALKQPVKAVVHTNLEVQDDKDPLNFNEDITDKLDQGGFAFLNNLPVNPSERVNLESRMVKFPPGLDIIKRTQSFQLFASFKNVTLKECGFGRDPSTTSKEARLLTIPDHIFLEMMKFADAISTVRLSPANLQALIIYMLRIVSVDFHLELSHKFLMSWQMIYKEARGEGKQILCPSLDELLLILCNAGVVPNDHCPVIDKLSTAQKRYKELVNNKLSSDKENSVHERLPRQPQHASSSITLPEMIKLLSNVINLCSTYTDEELADLFLIVAWLSLDTNFLKNQHLTLVFDNFLMACLDKIAAKEWPKILGYLGTALYKIDSHHHNAWYLTSHLPLSPRGIALQKAVSYLNMKALRGLKDITLPNEVTLEDILGFVRSNPISKGEDLFALYHYICFTDLSVGLPDPTTSRSTLEELHDAISKILLVIAETVHCTEGSIVKNRIHLLLAKWAAFATGLSSEEPRLFATKSINKKAEHIFL